jgi:predicted nucleic acid-binding protein
MVFDVPVELWPYDGAYIALAETIGAPLVTLDRRLGRSPEIACALETPPGG